MSWLGLLIKNGALLVFQYLKQVQYEYNQQIQSQQAIMVQLKCQKWEGQSLWGQTKKRPSLMRPRPFLISKSWWMILRETTSFFQVRVDDQGYSHILYVLDWYDYSLILLGAALQIRLAYIIRRSMQTRFLFQLAVLLGLLCCCWAVDWQAAGNVSQSNWTFIWSAIDTNIATYAPANLAGFSIALSDILNNAWSPAWNVFTIKLIDHSLDAVVYGYAFNNHWMWFNGRIYGGASYSFVIWKDYNCHTWNTVANADRQTSFGPLFTNNNLHTQITQAISALNGQFPTNPYDDVWQTIFLITNKMALLSPGTAYSVIAVQNGYSTTTDTLTELSGRFCSSGGVESYIFAYLTALQSSSGQKGVHKYVVLKTR